MRRPALLATVALALVLGVAACGDDDGSGSAGSENSSPPAEEVKEKQSEADAEVRARNERVRREYRERQEAAAPTPEEREAEETTESFYEILASDEGGKRRTTIDSDAFCELMSVRAIDETVRYARQATGEAKDWDCESAIELLVLRSKQTGSFKRAQRAEILGVNAEGDRATATIRFGKGPATSVSLVKEDGEWKLASTPTVEGR